MGFLGGLIKSVGGALPGIGTALSIGEGIFGAIKGAQQMGQAGKIKPQFSPYVASDFAKRKLGMAQQMFGGRMAGAAQQEQNIMANQANQISNVNRNATDSSQALALASGIQGQTNQAFNNLGVQEAQNKYSLLNNLNDAYQTMIGEGDKEQQSRMDKFGIDANTKSQLNQAGANNLFGGIDKTAGALIMSPYTMGNKKGMMGGLTKNQWGNVTRAMSTTF